MPNGTTIVRSCLLNFNGLTFDFRTCKHFLKLVEDRRLWKSFDFATKKMMGRQIKKLLLTLQIGDITEFRVRGFVSKYPIEKWKNNTITPNTLRKLSSSCPNLEVMEIREGYINFQQVGQIVHFCEQTRKNHWCNVLFQ